MKVFGFSIYYLLGLFAFLLADHYLGHGGLSAPRPRAGDSATRFVAGVAFSSRNGCGRLACPQWRRSGAVTPHMMAVDNRFC